MLPALALGAIFAAIASIVVLLARRRATRTPERGQPVEEIPEPAMPLEEGLRRLPGATVRRDGDVARIHLPTRADLGDGALTEVLFRAAASELAAARHGDPGLRSVAWLVVTVDGPDGSPVTLGRRARPGTTVYEPLERRGSGRLARGDTTGPVPALGGAARHEGRPVLEELQISGPLRAYLARQGVESSGAPFEEVALGLLQAAGWDLRPGDHAGTFVGSVAGEHAYAHIEPAGEIELPEDLVEQFLLDARQEGARRAVLVTDGYVPLASRRRAQRVPGARLVDRSGLHDLVEEATHEVIRRASPS